MMSLAISSYSTSTYRTSYIASFIEQWGVRGRLLPARKNEAWSFSTTSPAHKPCPSTHPPLSAPWDFYSVISCPAAQVISFSHSFIHSLFLPLPIPSLQVLEASAGAFSSGSVARLMFCCRCWIDSTGTKSSFSAFGHLFPVPPITSPTQSGAAPKDIPHCFQTPRQILMPIFHPLSFFNIGSLAV